MQILDLYRMRIHITGFCVTRQDQLSSTGLLRLAVRCTEHTSNSPHVALVSAVLIIQAFEGVFCFHKYRYPCQKIVCCLSELN